MRSPRPERIASCYNRCASSVTATKPGTERIRSKRIVIGADQAGKPLLDVIAAHLATKPGIKVVDLSQSGYYADLSRNLAETILDGTNDRGVLFCGARIGVSISANKVPCIRAALTHDTYSVERVAKSNDAQIITMGARHRSGTRQGHCR